MTRGVSILVGVIAMWFAAGLGATISLRTTGSVFTPNLVLVVIGSLGLHISRRRGLALGFLGGFLEAALAGTNMFPYLLTRTLVGVGVASFGAQTGERGPLVAAVTTAACSLTANLLFLFLTAPRGIAYFLLAAIVGAIVNGVLALVINALIARIASRRDRSRF